MNDSSSAHPEDFNEVEIEAIGIEVSSQPIELYKLLKLANVVAGGGEAKLLIADGYVAVNGELETRKRRKMYDGDFFEFNQEYYVVVFSDSLVKSTSDEEFASLSSEKESNVQANEQKAKKSRDSNSNKTSGRRNLDFLG
ncbi:RNA-binding S4 domain-containing protein [Vibrio sp. S4M6]|uniref:RNA-binding S4 domain-containing protein n=1 Tax=Vibrio sinus TaxID=2946865 RepID=UPI00202A7F1C|nr:RNA-binding S4 domain-containing protein [Vibrio sinus]MCL9780866.1 RNA-binding S4 domain-containing protein [Vibrio sinus]